MYQVATHRLLNTRNLSLSTCLSKALAGEGSSVRLQRDHKYKVLRSTNTEFLPSIPSKDVLVSSIQKIMVQG